MADLLDYDLTTAIISTDVVYVLRDPSGTPVDRRMTVAGLFKAWTGNDSVSAHASLSAAITAIGATQATIEIPATTTVSASLTIPRNVTLLFSGTGQISVSSGQTLTVNGPIGAPYRQIFAGTGSVIVNGQSVVPQWFGSTANAQHVDTGGMTSASAVLTATGAGFVSTDVGKTITVNEAGAAGIPLITTISSYTSATQVTLAASASATVSNKRVIWGTLDTTGILNAVLSTAPVYFPKGKYLLRMVAGGAAPIAGGSVLYGDGEDSIIYVIGSDGAAGGDTDQRAALQVTGSNVRLHHLHMIGENLPFDPVINNESNAVLVNTSVDNVDVDDCFFENLFGFPIHQVGAATRVNNRRNRVFYCANGINNNADFSDQSHNHIYHSEGFEASGAHSNISDNIIDFPYIVGISLGGRTAVADTGPGTICRGNVIKDSQGAGIVLSDGFIDGLIADNTITNTELPGINITGGGFNPVSGNTIIGNVLRNVGQDAAGPTGITVNTDATDTRILNNDIQSAGHGIFLGSINNVTIEGNRIEGSGGSGGRDLLIFAATNTRIRNNHWVNNNFEVGAGTPTFAIADDGLVNSPAQITANQDDYETFAYSTLRLNTDASRNITGFKTGASERTIRIVNVGAQNIVLKHLTTSSAANQIIGIAAADVTVAGGEAAVLVYDSTSTKWRVTSKH